jgi:DNA polymerase-3 subunit delta
MLIFLYGQDGYRSKEELRRVIEKNRINNSDWFDFIRIDASDKQVEIFKELKQTANTISMFSQKKLVIIEDVFSLNQESQDEISEFLKKKKIEDSKDITIIFWTSEADVKSDLFKYLNSKAECKEFKFLQGAQLKKWIKDFVDKEKGSIDNSAAEKLTERIGNDLWRMSNELNKLLSYNKTIRLENVELLVRPEIDLNIFQLVDAIGYKQKAKVLSLFGQYIESGESEYYLLSMIAYQIRNLIKAKTAKDIELLGLHPFVVRKTKQQVENFTLEELKKIYHQLMMIDFESKLGKVDITAALELFLTNL